MTIPENVINLLKSTRFVHLATSHNDVPHVSLMNYTYYKNGDTHEVIISTPKTTTKYENMVHNPKVAILVHDWMSVKSKDDQLSGRRNSLYEMLANINKNELGRVSVMMVGSAEIVDTNLQAYLFYKLLHRNNSQIDESQVKNYIEDDQTAIVVIKVLSCKVTDTDNNVSEY